MRLSTVESAVPAPIPLRHHRSLQAFIASLLVSFLGDQIYLLALPWLVYNLTGSALAMGSLYAVEQLPVLLNPLLGALVDRVNRRRIMIAADLVRTVTVALVPLLWYTHTLQVWHLYLLGMVLMTCGEVYNVCTFAITPLVVPEGDVPVLNSIFLSLFGLSFSIGPAVAGLLIAQIGAPLALLIDAFSFMVTVAALLWFRPGDPPAVASSPSLFSEAWAGLKYYVTHAILLPLGIYMLLANLAFAVFLSQILYFYRHDLGLSPQTVGLIYTCFGVATLVANLIAPYLMKRVPWPRLLTWSRIWSGLFMMAHAAVSRLGLLGGSLAAAGIAEVAGTVSVTLRQRVIPRDMLGRVAATHTLFCLAASPLGGLIGGAIGQAWGARWALVVGGCIYVISSLVVLLSPLRRVSASSGTDQAVERPLAP